MTFIKCFMKFTQLCPTLCDPTDYPVHGILQARILEWVAFPFSRGSSQPRDRTQVSQIAGGFFTSWATREAQSRAYSDINKAVIELSLWSHIISYTYLYNSILIAILGGRYQKYPPIFLFGVGARNSKYRTEWKPQSYLTLCDPVDCSLSGSSVHGILQARILEWATIPFSRGSSRCMYRTGVSCITGTFFTSWVTREDIENICNNWFTLL